MTKALKIKSLHIKNFKSIVDLTINEPNPFTVFVGPNGSGKSNIFEALEFARFAMSGLDFFGLFNEDWLNYNLTKSEHSIAILDEEYKVGHIISEVLHGFGGLMKLPYAFDKKNNPVRDINEKDIYKFIEKSNRIFVENKKLQKINFKDDNKLTLSCDNLEKVLKRLLENKEKREEISEWLELFLPEFDRIEVQKSEFSSNENLLIYQKHYERPFNKELISDGTYNIIALLTAVYQSDEPQFLCIEEPENGLHPKVIKQLVNFFRDACEEKGHYIWLNTHSQTLVSVLEPKEIILVDKKNGETQIKQFDKNFDMHGFVMDEAWLTNALGGGLPW